MASTPTHLANHAARESGVETQRPRASCWNSLMRESYPGPRHLVSVHTPGRMVARVQGAGRYAAAGSWEDPDPGLCIGYWSVLAVETREGGGGSAERIWLCVFLRVERSWLCVSLRDRAVRAGQVRGCLWLVPVGWVSNCAITGGVQILESYPNTRCDFPWSPSCTAASSCSRQKQTVRLACAVY